MSSGWEIAAWEGVAIGMRGTAVHWTFLGVEGGRGERHTFRGGRGGAGRGRKVQHVKRRVNSLRFSFMRRLNSGF